MGAQLYDLTVVDYGNPIRVPDGGKSVGDYDGSSISQQLLQCFLDDQLRVGIDARGGLVKDEDGRLCRSLVVDV